MDHAPQAGMGCHAIAAPHPVDPFCGSGGIRVTLAGSQAASACGLTVDLGSRRRGAPICQLARLLVAAGHDPDALLFIERDSKPCFRPLALWRWVGLTVEEGASSARVRKWRPIPDARREVARITGHSDVSGGKHPADHSAPPAGFAVKAAGVQHD